MHRFHLNIPYLLRKDINELYLANAMRAFAISTIAIFIPIFLLKQGFGFIGVGIYFLLHSLFMMFTSYFSLKIAGKYGYRKNVLFSAPFIIAYFWAMYNIVFLRTILPDIAVIFVLVILASIGDSLYWTGFHVEFAKATKVKKSAKQFGIINITSTLASAAAPLIGAEFISSWGFNFMFIIVMCILVAATLPLFLSKEKHIPFKLSVNDLVLEKNSKFVLPFFGEGVHYVALSIVWPLFLYLLFVAYNDIGSIYTLANVFFVVSTIIISHKINTANKESFLKIGTWTHSFSMIIRLFAKTFLSMNFAMIFAGFTNAVMNNPYHSMFYNNAKKRGITAIIYMRELYLNMGRVAGGIIFLILLLFFQPETVLAIMMFIGALFVLFRANMNEK